MNENPNFKDMLDQSYQWPDFYEFKFIIKTEDKQQVLDQLATFGGCMITETLSKEGKYTSINARKLIKNTDEIIDVYMSMKDIKGVISL